VVSAVVAGGSDWSVSSLNPLDAIQIGMTRMALDTMLLAYIANGAYAMQQERETGTLDVGKAADIVVLDRDLPAIPPSEIHRAKVLLTLLEGREVYRSPGFP
jgi:predicted amidohydrolase YtcJ